MLSRSSYPSPVSPLRLILFWLCGAILLLLFMGVLMIAPLPGFALLMLLLGGGVIIFAVPAAWLAVALVLLTFALVGPAESLGRIPKLFWLPYLLGLAMAVKAMIMAPVAQLGRGQKAAPMAGVGGSKLMGGAFLLLVLFSLAVNASGGVQFILATRDYFWLLGLLALALVSRLELDKALVWLRLLPALILIQFPLVLYQHFFVSRSTRFTTHDAVVGLFGGNAEGGGASGAMGMFSLVVVVYAFARFRHGLMSWYAALAVIAAGLAAIGLAEVKYVVLVSPLVVLAFFGLRETLRRPMLLMSLVLVCALIPVFLYAYWKMFEPPGAKTYGGFGKYVSVIVERNLDSEQIDMTTGEMSRISALKFWAKENSLRTDPLRTVIGHGIGSSRIGFFPGEVAVKYRFKIGRSSLAVLLWETGALGAGLVVGLLLAGLRLAAKARRLLPADAKEALIACQFSTAVLVVALLGLPYNADLVGTPQLQLLVIMAFTLVLMVIRQFGAPQRPGLSGR
ncbi:hypothetical protein [Roseateles violae]|uniref:O-antigen ligase-like membrane protein n=1 Tax=Roseateles violae TaxID=3058042 RepID=A0ABT8DS17_9BURK|nr:hypothetical protein [Pelomonas sp. PFR6]MDN3920858.1 hypothetical protein [Pelomonas sp. PFR6]